MISTSALVSPIGSKVNDIGVCGLPTQMNVAMCNAPIYNEKNEKLEESMDAEKLAAEKRGFEYLSKLVKKLRLDAD